MIPLILVSKAEETLSAYIDKLIKEKSFVLSHITTIRPTRKELTIDQVRSVKKDIILSTSYKRLIIFYSFDNATLEAQNALLKTLEEKSDDNQFILAAQNKERIIPTIRSRAQIINLDKNDGSDYIVRPSTQALLTYLIKAESFEFLSHPVVSGINREEAEILLEECLVYFKRIGNATHKVSILKKILQSLSLLQNNNLNPQLTIDNVLIFIKKNYNLKG